MRFTNDPPTEEQYCFPIVRPRLRNPITFTVGCKELRGCYTHWYGGKTIACCSPAMCDACELNVKQTWQGHVIAHRHEDDHLVLVVFTLPVKQFFKKHLCQSDGVFGVSCRLLRMGNRETGPIGCQYLGRDTDRPVVSLIALEKVVTRLYADNGNQREVHLER